MATPDWVKKEKENPAPVVPMPDSMRAKMDYPLGKK